MIGLGVGIDYALFIVTRFREAYRENGGDVDGAVELAMDTAGRAVLFAGATVVIALLGHVRARRQLPLRRRDRGVARRCCSCSPLADAAARAARASSGDASASRTRAPRGRAERGTQARLLGALGRRRSSGARRWPRSRATAIMLALAAPALGLRLGSSDAGNDPAGHDHAQGLRPARAGLRPGLQRAAAARRASCPQRGRRGRRWRSSTHDAARDTPGVASVAPPRLNPPATRPRSRSSRRSSPQSAATTSLVKHLRDDGAAAGRAGTGATRLRRRRDRRRRSTSPTCSRASCRCSSASSSLLSALLLLVVFRSLVIPLQAAVMNLLSIGASLGVVQAIFERGWLGGLFGIQPRPDRGVHPGDGVRDRVRPLDGLRGLPRLAHPRGVARTAATRAPRSARARSHRPRDHRRRRGDGRRLRVLRRSATTACSSCSASRWRRRSSSTRSSSARSCCPPCSSCSAPHLGVPALARPAPAAARDRA